MASQATKGRAAASNGADPERRDHLRDRQQQERLAEQAARASWLIEGHTPYDSDWDLDLSWPAADMVEDKVAAGLEVPGEFKLDAVLVEGKYSEKTGRLLRGSLRRKRVGSYEGLEALRESTIGQMREYDDFAYGGNPAIPGHVPGGGPLGQYVPLWPGPVTRQLYWQDYWMMSAKSFEAYNHDPISWRCVHMKAEFALGKGLLSKVTYGGNAGTKAGQTHDKAQEAWNEFWDRNNMDNRMDMFARDLSIMGEQFFRYFRGPKTGTLTIRSLDPASIYDIITDPEDHETVFAYHQQFQTPYQLYPPTSGSPPSGVKAPQGATQPGAVTRYIIRQILPQEIDHYKINASAYERRGRSDLYPALGWIKRLRDYLTSHVIRADMLSRICWDLTVKGNDSAVVAQRSRMFPHGQAPPPGSVFGHNEATTLQALVPQASSGGAATRGDPMLDALVTMTADAIGLPKDWLGFGLQNTRAGALMATEPAARSLEELQGTMEQVIHDQFDRVMAAARIKDAELEVTFPSIATEDRSEKLKDLAFMESMGWASKQTAATMAAKEVGITTYNFDEEQELIAEEFPEPETDADGAPVQGDGTVRRPIINSSSRQAYKLDPTRSPMQQDEPPGMALPAAPGEPGAAPGAVPPAGDGEPPTRNGFPANENPASAAGAKNLKGQLTVKEDEPVFTKDQVMELLREAGKEPRRRPEDPGYQRSREEYRRASAENLAELVRATNATREAARAAELRESENRGLLRRALDALAGNKPEVHTSQGDVEEAE